MNNIIKLTSLYFVGVVIKSTTSGEVACLSLGGGGGGGGGGKYTDCRPPIYTQLGCLSVGISYLIKHYYRVGHIAEIKHAYVASGDEYCHNLERLLRAPLFERVPEIII